MRRTSNGPLPDDLLSTCVSCGFCLPACPTYNLTGDERSSPRGRINLMRALQEGTLTADDPTMIEESSFCMGCRACEPVCPAGVQYGHLLEQWRHEVWQGDHKPVLVRLLTAIVTHRRLVHLLGVPRLLRHLVTSRGGRQVATAGEPADRSPARDATRPGAQLMLGCFERALFPAVSDAAQALAPELEVPAPQGCCGALHAHNADPERGSAMAERLGSELPGLIVTTAGGCAAHLASVLGEERVLELSQYLSTAWRPTGHLLFGGRRARVALQDSCHLRNGLGVWREPRDLIAAVADYVELPGAATCCGAAGTYSLLRPADSRAVLAPKLEALEEANVDVVVALNPGCLRQLRSGLARAGSPITAMHLAELLLAARQNRDIGAPHRKGPLRLLRRGSRGRQAQPRGGTGAG
ncbi:(Fe-S)-binding protein [Nonomuraea polychroma]|nr:(Fe-S)-binding protein [Nonomuraea polychroma]